VNVKSRFPNSRLASVAVVTLVLAVTGSALASTTAASRVKTRRTSTLGTILVDGKGRTLYLFEKDKGGRSACYGSCAANWPPYLTTGKPTAGTGVKKALLGTTRRTDGKLQVTYKRHPLYRFGYDTKAGQTTGENVNAFGSDWYVVSPKGVKVEPKPSGGSGSGGGATGPTGSGGYGGGGYGGGGG
jgi:predicted lipoprotein with Yx(FWY)xxD motif